MRCYIIMISRYFLKFLNDKINYDNLYYFIFIFILIYMAACRSEKTLVNSINHWEICACQETKVLQATNMELGKMGSGRCRNHFGPSIKLKWIAIVKPLKIKCKMVYFDFFDTSYMIPQNLTHLGYFVNELIFLLNYKIINLNMFCIAWEGMGLSNKL